MTDAEITTLYAEHAKVERCLSFVKQAKDWRPPTLTMPCAEMQLAGIEDDLNALIRKMSACLGILDRAIEHQEEKWRQVA